MKRILAILLCVLMLVTVLVACDNTSEESKATTSTDTSTDVSSEESTVRQLFDGIEKIGGDGEQEIVFLVGGLEFGERYGSKEIFAAELNDELINDAVYNRNALVEEYHGIKIAEVSTTTSGELISKLTTQQGASLDSYQVVLPIMNDAAGYAIQDYFYDLLGDDVKPYLDLSYEWWDQKANTDLTIGGRLFFTTGYMSILDNECTHAFVFNNDVITEVGLESPYDLVKNKQWTLDKMMTMAKDVTKDSDGVGGMGDGDTYGAWINTGMFRSMYLGTGRRLITKDENDLPIVAVESEDARNMISKIAPIAGSDDVIIIEKITQYSPFSDVYAFSTDAVANKRALFRAVALTDITELSAYDCDYGVLPAPLADTNQDRYYCAVSTVLTPGIAIPTTNPDPKTAALVLAAMGEASVDTLNYSYYEVLLKLRKANEKSAEMLDIIFENRVYDLGVVFGSTWGNLIYVLDVGNGIGNNGEDNFSSYYGQYEESIKAAIQKTVDAFEALP